MTFKNPQFLLFFIPLAGILFFAGANREKRLFNLKFPFTFIPGRKTIKLKLFEILPFYMRLLAASLLIIALARPQKILRETIPPSEGIDILLMMDTSTSMAALDFEPQNRLDAAKQTAEEFILKRDYDRIGLGIFAGVAVISCPLTSDHNTLIEYISQVSLAMTLSDGTAIGDAIATGVSHIKDSKAKSKIIILLTDGRSNTGTLSDPLAAAKIAKDFNVKVYTIGVAKKGKAKVPTQNPLMPYIYIEDDLNEPSLAEIAKVTGAKYYRATNILELQNIYSEIDTLEKTKFNAAKKTEYADFYQYFLFAAFVIIVLILFLEKTFFLTVP